MKNTTITEIEQAMLPFLDNAQMNQLHEVLTHSLWGKEIVVCENQESVSPKDDELLEMFVSSKRVEGCSEKTLRYYRTTINKMFSSVTQKVIAGSGEPFTTTMVNPCQSAGRSSFPVWLHIPDPPAANARSAAGISGRAWSCSS